MATVSVSVSGVDTVVGNLRAYQARVRDQIVALIVETCLAIERDAKLEARVDTGRLRASIRTDVRQALEELVGIVFTDVTYAPFIEFGTTRLAAHPFLFPAWEAHVGPFVERLRQILNP